MNARLVKAIERGSQIAKYSNLKLFNPSQPRDDAGRWSGYGPTAKLPTDISQNIQVADKKGDCVDQCLYHLLEPKNGGATDIRDNRFWMCVNKCMGTA